MNLRNYIGEATANDKKLMLERKDLTSRLKNVSAFANTQGGKRLFGVANDGSLVGLADAQGDAKFISEAIKMQKCSVPEIGLPTIHSPIRYSRIFYTRWNVLTKSNRVMDALDDDELSGGVITLQKVFDFVRTNSKKKWRKTLNFGAVPKLKHNAYKENRKGETVVKSVMLVVVSAVLIVFSAAAEGLPSIEDVRVDALVSSHWGQRSDTGYSNTGNPCFNYFTPNNYPCGCVATPFAQLLRYWRYPASVKPGVSRCLVDGVERQLEYGGVEYDYDAMPYVTAGADERQREAIGRLTFDCAASLHSMFSRGNTFAYGMVSFVQLREIFGYANAIGYVPVKASVPSAAIKNTIIANLDAKCPVMITLFATANEMTHQALIDGYGYHGGKLYFHFNLGWCNVRGDDAWYELDRSMDLTSGYYYDLIDGLVYNIFPNRTGDVLSGRVVDQDGNPVANAVVQASCSGKVVDMVQTDAKGIYAFVLAGGTTYKVSCEGCSISVALPSSVSARRLSSSKKEVDIWQDPFHPGLTEGGTLGGSSGNDIQLLGEHESVYYTVKFVVDPEKGSATGELEQEVESGKGAVVPTVVANEGWTFLGWYTEASGGTKITALTKVTDNVTYYAHWAENGGGGSGGGSGGGVYGGKVNDISFAKAQTVDGVLYGADGAFAGTVQLKVGKINKKNGMVSISATATLLDGKKITGKAVTVKLGDDETLSGTVKVKAPIGDMHFVMDADGTFTFDGDSGYSMAEGVVGGNLPDGTMTFMVDIGGMPNFGSGLIAIEETLPLNLTAKVSGGKKIDFGKAASVKYAKVKAGNETWYELDGLDDEKKPNVSGLKLTYTPKTGAFKGSFKIYATNEGSVAPDKKPTLKTYTVNVTGFFVDGVGGGQATLKKPAASWPVTLEFE